MSNNLQTELEAILHGAAFAPITDRAFLRITGPDATRWLNGMVTNSIQSLQPGEGNYNFLLNAQGRIQGDCTIYREPVPHHSGFLLETAKTQLEAVQQILDKFIIMDDVELSPGLHVLDDQVEVAPVGMTIMGPQARLWIDKLFTAREDFWTKVEPTPQGTITPVHFDAFEAMILTPRLLPQAPATPIYQVWSAGNDFIREFYRVFEFYRIPKASPEALEAFRILSGTPKYGTDITEKYLPQETNQPHALHFAKGCYLGQEIVERIRSRGQVHRLFTPLRLEGELPATLPTPLEANGKPAGEITSATLVPTREGDQLLALGYARREFLDTNQPLTYAGGTAVPRTASKLS